jgi:ethanolamine utilization microcompartment shell protein EutL
VSIAVVFAGKEEGGAGMKETEIGGVIVMLAGTDFVLSAVEVAVTVTVLPVGTAAGALYVVALPLAV